MVWEHLSYFKTGKDFAKTIFYLGSSFIQSGYTYFYLVFREDKIALHLT
jgi:hypothetical protein